MSPGIECWYIWKLRVALDTSKISDLPLFQEPLSQTELIHESSSLIAVLVLSLANRIKVLFLFIGKIICNSTEFNQKRSKENISVEFNSRYSSFSYLFSTLSRATCECVTKSPLLKLYFFSISFHLFSYFERIAIEVLSFIIFFGVVIFFFLAGGLKFFKKIIIKWFKFF